MFEIPFTIIGEAGKVLLADDVSVEQWKRISQYVEAVIGFRPQNKNAE